MNSLPQKKHINLDEITSKNDLLQYDILDMNFSFCNSKSLLHDALRDITIITWSLDIDYLLAKHWRMNKLLEDLECISRYIEMNILGILGSEYWEKRYTESFIELRKEEWRTYQSKDLPEIEQHYLFIAICDQKNAYNLLVHKQ